MDKRKTFLNWSGGKDAAIALYYLIKSNAFKVDCLLTTIDKNTLRISMQGIKVDLLKQQLKSLEPQHSTIVEMPQQPSMQQYNSIMNYELKRLKSEGYTTAAYGDIFLDDIREYREQQLAQHGMQTVFPLWSLDTRKLLEKFIKLGFKAVVVAIRKDKLDESFLGRSLDEEFLADLPSKIDPCGENGEYHTFCYDGPVFRHSVAFEKEAIFQKTYKAPSGSKEQSISYLFQDLTPIENQIKS